MIDLFPIYFVNVWFETLYSIIISIFFCRNLLMAFGLEDVLTNLFIILFALLTIFIYTLAHLDFYIYSFIPLHNI